MNHPFMIALEEYTENGALSGKMSYIYKDNPVDFCHAVDAYKQMKLSYTDEEGVTHETNLKKYKVTPQILAYSTIADMDEFKRVNHIGI